MEGAKNHWARKSCQWNVQICTYNGRTLSTDEKVYELEDELEKIKWDVVGLSEIRRPGEDKINLQRTGHTFYWKGGVTRNNGVGFLINKNLAANVSNYIGVSDRVAMIIIKINKRYNIKIIQAYLPTSDHTDEEVQTVYEDIDNLMTNHKTHYTVLMGDFNAKVGIKETDETCMGNFGIGQRNDRGHQLVFFAEHHRLFIGNTFFKKKVSRKWTWISPNATTKNEIDFILTDKKRILKDVSVINQFNTGSDHRIVRSTICINTKHERAKLIKKRPIVNTANLKYKSEDYCIQLSNRFAPLAEEMTQEIDNDINTVNDRLVSVLTETAKEIAGTTRKPKVDKLSASTHQLLERRRQLKRDGTSNQRIEYSELCKLIRRKMKEDINNYHVKEIEDSIDKNTSSKQKMRKQILGRQEIYTLKESDGTIITERDRIIQRTEEFMTELYKGRDQIDQRLPNSKPDDFQIPSVLRKEVEFAIYKLSNGKAAGDDNVTNEMLKLGGDPVVDVLTLLINKCISIKETPDSWKRAVILLLHKKGDKADLRNYRPISLLPAIYKVFSRIFLNRIKQQLNFYQPIEQAGFRTGYSTIDHLHTINQLIEKASEFNIPLCMAFVDYEKAFDSVEFGPLLNSLKNQGIESSYINILNEIYLKATSVIRLHEDSNEIKLSRGVRQGDSISPNLFNACLEDVVFRRMELEGKGINIDGKTLTNLRFADDLVLFAHTAIDLQALLEDLNNKSTDAGLKIHTGKTKVMFNQHASKGPIAIGNVTIEAVQQYKYLGQIVTDNRDNVPEVNNRIRSGWAAFAKYDSLMRSRSIPQKVKTKAFNQCILPAMTYGAETWTTSSTTMFKMAVAQRRMERIMLGITLRDRKRNEWVRNRTKVMDISTSIIRKKWQWAGHIMRRTDDRWTRRMTEWYPRSSLRRRGRPSRRWDEELVNHCSQQWRRQAADRQRWASIEEGFLQKWREETPSR